MRQLLGIAILLCLAWLLGRLMAKWSMERPWVRVMAIIFLASAVMLPKTMFLAMNMAGFAVQPAPQVVLNLASLLLCSLCFYFLNRRIKSDRQVGGFLRLVWAYAAFAALLLALHPLALDLANNARVMDRNSNGDSLPMLLSWSAAGHLGLVAFASALAAWHRNKGRLSWRILLPWPADKT